jgi:predicted permease
MNRFRLDLAYAFRALRHSPGFTAVAVLSLGLGIGANTAIFSLLHAVLLRSLPVDHPEQLVLLTDPNVGYMAADTTTTGDRPLMSYPEFEILRAQNRVFTSMAAMDSTTIDLDARIEGSSAQRIKLRTQFVSGEFFPLLGIQPALGRALTPEEDRVRGANPVAVISYDLWQRRFSGDPAALGHTVLIGRTGFRIIGVASRDFHGTLAGWPVEIWLPLTMEPTARPGHDDLTPHDTLWLQVMGRLRPGVSRPAAQAAMNVVFQQVIRDWSASLPSGVDRRDLLNQRLLLRDGDRGTSSIRDDFGDPLLLMMGMVAVVLLIACANIANLTLARATGRRRELGVRLALGAGRGQLIRQMLTESLVVAAMGGIVGALLSLWGAELLQHLAAGTVNGLALDGQRDARVFAFAFTVAFGTAVLFGLFPAIRATRVDINPVLSAGTRGTIGSRGAARAGRLLVVAQVALSVLLLMGGTLLVRSLQRLRTSPAGFDREHLALLRTDPGAAGIKGAATGAFYREVVQRIAQVRGIDGVTLADQSPYGGDSGDQVSIEGVTGRPPNELRSRWTLVGAGYFRTMGIPMLSGREISAEDAARERAVCVVNQSFVARYFPQSDPIGRHLTDEYPTTRTTYEIIGVSADAHEHGMVDRGRPRFYGSIFHPIGGVNGLTITAHTAGNPARSLEDLRKALDAFNPDLPILALRTGEEQVGRSLAVERIVAQLAASFGVLALVMAAVGLYGLLAYSISRRTGEIGLRMALGAGSREVIAMVLRETLWLVAAGVVVGIPAAIGSAQLLRGMLAGISPADPLSIAVAVGVIVAAGLAAAWSPAHRASRVDPMTALRWE